MFNVNCVDPDQTPCSVASDVCQGQLFFLTLGINFINLSGDRFIPVVVTTPG